MLCEFKLTSIPRTIMKPTCFITSAVLGLSLLSASAASYTSNFAGLGAGDSLDGFDGWTQSEANYSDVDGTIPWAFGNAFSTPDGPRPAAAVGGYYNTDPAVAGSFYASHTLSLVGAMAFTMNLAIVDSDYGFVIDDITYGEERNTFRVGFFGSDSSEIFALVFDPNAGTESGSNTSWNVSASSGGIKSTATMAILESQLYGLTVSLTPNGADLDYAFSLASDLNTANSSGSLTGLASSAINELRVGIDPLNGPNGDQYGTNHIVFDGVVAAIPEPSSLLLLAAAAGGMAFRRRRI